MANEKRLIDVNDAVKLLRGKCVAKYPSTFLVGIFASADEILKMPTVDAVPVVHGRWLKVQEPLGYRDVDCVECSACHESWIIDEDYEFDDFGGWNYCPNCGAKMDGGDEDG